MFVQVALLSPPFSVLTYRAPTDFPLEFWQPGLRVVVPLGRGRENSRVALLLSTSETSGLDSRVKIKDITWPLELEPIIHPDLLYLMQELKIRQGEEVGKIAKALLLPGFKSLNFVVHLVEEQEVKVYSLNDLVLATPLVRSHLAKELLEGRAKLLPGPRSAAEEECLSLNCDPPWPVRPAAKLQIKILEYLHNNGTSTRKNLNRALGGNLSSPLRTLLNNGAIIIGRGENQVEAENLALLPPKTRPFTLNDEQQACVDQLAKALDQHKFYVSLLYGITGSGKTAVYLDLAHKVLKQGRSVLLLVPEVALALKLLQDAHTIYPETKVVLFHGYQLPSLREKIWQEVAMAPASLVIGTRSALFLPVQNLGCVILDEEHDASFKQEEGFVYHAKEIAWARAKYNQALLILGSATPDVRTFHAAQTESLPLLRLVHRISGRDLPPIELIDTREPRSMSKAVTLLSEKSLATLEATLNRGEQAVILINRRGYAPHMYCLECGKAEHCPECEIALTYHKARGRLVCHYCGYSKPFPSPCSICGSAAFLPMGEGTERLAEELSTYLGERVLRLDRDSTSRVGSMEAILQAFAREEAQVLVGTQMLSKGHHFPKVTLVIAADCDMGLNFPDYRAAERTFQLLIQSAGRAGRGALPGQVLLQTRDVSHYCFKYVLANDYEGFYHNEIQRRERHAYPPFVNLALVRLSYEREDPKAPLELQNLAQAMKPLALNLGVRLLGPAPAPLAVLRNRERFQILLKARTWSAIREVYQRALKNCKLKFLRSTLDLDPMNML
ncbi:MAG: primosomal protein N' [Desulfovibrionaceae bacterium]|nr:primosomal protein N' [Desulfovibrionaceae bacterium]